MSFKKSDKQKIISKVEDRFNIEVGKWYFSNSLNQFKSGSRRICIWITDGGRIALRHQTGGSKSKDRITPRSWTLNTPRYYTTIDGLLDRIKHHVMPVIENYINH